MLEIRNKKVERLEKLRDRRGKIGLVIGFFASILITGDVIGAIVGGCIVGFITYTMNHQAVMAAKEMEERDYGKK